MEEIMHETNTNGHGKFPEYWQEFMMSMLNLFAVLIEQIHEASEITVIRRKAGLSAGCPCCISRALRTNRPVWQNTRCGKKVDKTHEMGMNYVCG
jgi:hypothetical protein